MTSELKSTSSRFLGTAAVFNEISRLGRHFIGLLVVGVLIGLACLPLNLVDRIQEWLFKFLPTTGENPWTSIGLLIVLTPVVVMPILLILQRGPWRAGAGSGIPSTMNALEDPSLMPSAMEAGSTVHRGILWSLATAAMFPLGREGPVVQFGSAVARACQKRWPNWMPALTERQMVAIGGGAGLAGGFNTPLLGVVFMLEELTAEYSIVTIWPALLVCIAAAGFSNLGGEPIFGLGLINVFAPESEQLLLAVPIGIAAGLVGGFFNRGLVWSTSRLAPMVRQRPLRTGLFLGAALSLLALLSWGTSTADGEALVKQLLERGLPELGSDHSNVRSGLVSIWITVVRVIGPMLALAPGVPGGLIDPSLTFGAVLGYSTCAVIGFSTQVGVGLGLAAGLAGATQLPLVSLIFSWRLVGDQQLFAGACLTAIIAAYTGRLVSRTPVYHALAKLQRAPRL